MGPQRDATASDDPAAREDSIESLLRSTDRDTEEIVDALRESGPRRHVSETSVDDVLTELSRPQEESDDPFALSGGPTRTVSTSGIDEVFESLEAEAPSLPPEPGADASSGSAGGESAANGSRSASTAMGADSASGGPAASGDRSESTTLTFDGDAEQPPDADGDAEPFGDLVGGEPTRTVSDEGVDDILDSLDDPAASPVGAPSQAADEAADDLRPEDPEGELVDLLTEDESAPSAAADDRTDDSAGNEDDEERNRIADAAAALAEHRRDETGSTVDSDRSTSADDEAFERADPESEAPGSESPAEPVALRSDTVAPGDSRPLVTRAELEEIAAPVTKPASADEPATGLAAGSDPATSTEVDRGSESDPSAAAEPDGAATDAPVASRTGPRLAPTARGVGTPREAVTVDAVIAPTDASLDGSAPAAAVNVDDVGRPEPTARADGDRSTDRSGSAAGSGASVVRRVGSIVRRFAARMRR